MLLRRAGLVLITLLLALAAPGSARPATTITTIVRTPISGLLFTNCSVPETIAFSGMTRSVFHFVLDGQGTAHFSGISESNGVGTGLLTGTSYRFVSASSSSTIEAPDSLSYHNTFTNTFLLLSRGPQDNLRMHVTQHVTVTPEGVLTAEVLNIWFECVG
jgi:hypothetical protein